MPLKIRVSLPILTQRIIIFRVLKLYCSVLMFFIALPALASDLDQGTDTHLSPDQIQTLTNWTANAKTQLRDALNNVKTAANSQDARDQLHTAFQTIITSGDHNPGETFFRYTLNRALKLSDFIGSTEQNSYIEDLQKRLLWVSAESALAFPNSDFSKSAEYGISNTEFILSWSDSILNGSVQYQVAVMALGFLENDLFRDADHVLLAPQITEIDSFLNSMKSAKKKDSDFVKGMPLVRLTYSRVLTELQRIPRFSGLIDDPENPGLDYYRKTIRGNLSDPDLDTRLRAMKSLETLELKDGDETRLAEMLNDPSYQICSGSLDVFRHVIQVSNSAANNLYNAAVYQKIRECRDAAIILLGRIHSVQSNAYLSSLYHSNCIGSDISTLVQYSIALSQRAPGPDLLSTSAALCSGDLCVGDFVAAQIQGQVIQGPISAVNRDQVMIDGPYPGWLPIKTIGRKVSCYQNVCAQDFGMLKETGGHKVGSAFKRVVMGLTMMDLVTGDFGNSEIAIYHTFLNVTAVFTNGLIQVKEVNDGALGGWSTTDKFEKSMNAFPDQEHCYVPVQ